MNQEIAQLNRRISELEQIVKALLAPKSKARVIVSNEDVITDIRVDGLNLQYFQNGEWVTWHTGTACE